MEGGSGFDHRTDILCWKEQRSVDVTKSGSFGFGRSGRGKVYPGLLSRGPVTDWPDPALGSVTILAQASLGIFFEVSVHCSTDIRVA